MLERLAYLAIMRLTLWQSITGNMWLYSIVGGLFAGVFEETGGSSLLKPCFEKTRNDETRSCSGGHGGIEAVIC